jgi:hypothetical protein
MGIPRGVENDNERRTILSSGGSIKEDDGQDPRPFNAWHDITHDQSHLSASNCSCRRFIVNNETNRLSFSLTSSPRRVSLPQITLAIRPRLHHHPMFSCYLLRILAPSAFLFGHLP